jgi:hypothetical protein
MRNSCFIIIIAFYFLIACAGGCMEPDLENEALAKTITLKVHDKQIVFNALNITYSNYGHEHVSYRPDEQFAATVGVYFFLLSDDNSSNSITLYMGVNQTSTEPVSWGNYAITMVHASDDQNTVVVKIVRKQN